MPPPNKVFVAWKKSHYPTLFILKIIIKNMYLTESEYKDTP